MADCRHEALGDPCPTCAALAAAVPQSLAAREPRNGRAARHMTSLAQHFRDGGLDWRADFADAIKARQWRRIDLWVKLMPYLLTGSGRHGPLKGPRRKGALTKAALAKLRELEERGL